ncbi:c-type cytochrome [Novosphingobium bradum]|uniref:C-type cytochrome n=1 Tax=Novosphingobium bradum TaxID=1737444 RepID=A0ABV7IN35_9SPHN
MKTGSKIVSSALAAAIVALSAAPALAAPPAPVVDQVFHQRCEACHSTAKGARPGIGPNLAGVVGRTAGSTAFNYSDALKKSGIKWTPANLDRFLTAPSRMVPGTRMAVAISDPAQRAQLIRFLSRAR